MGAGWERATPPSPIRCPPCRKFTPALAAAYSQWTKTDRPDLAELVFVSCDRTRPAFEAYHDAMNFPAVSYDDGARERLMSALGVTGIPALVIVSGDGRVVQADGKAHVIKRGSLAGWPWAGEKAPLGVGNLPVAVQWVLMGIAYLVLRWLIVGGWGKK